MKLRSFKQRLSHAVNLSPIRVTLNSPEIEAAATLARIRVKAEVHEENNPSERAVFYLRRFTSSPDFRVDY